MIRQMANRIVRKLGDSEYAVTMLCAMLMKKFNPEMAVKLLRVANEVSDMMIASDRQAAEELVLAVRELVGKKGEVPEAFKKQWKDKDKDNDGKENEPKPDFLKKKEKKSGEVPEAFKKQWKKNDKGDKKDDGDKEDKDDKKPDFLKKKGAWEPVRKDVDVRKRNKEVHQSLTSFAPSLSMKMRKRISGAMREFGYDVQPREFDREWSAYLAYVDYESNNNKYHYYVVLSFETPSGETLYTGWNCSGRIGIIERAYDLTAKYLGGPATSLARAIAACEKHLRTKERKGYDRVKMVRG